jgi:glycosyltransferase involved in cell wall biosynthesis
LNSETQIACRRVLFAHDGPLEVGPDGTPMGVHYTGALLDRYFQLGSQLTFLMRCRAVSADGVDRYTPLARDGFRFVPAPNVKGPLKSLVHSRALARIIRAEVERHDIVVVRLPSTIGRWTFWEAKRQGKQVLSEFMACTWDALWNYSWLGKLSAPYYFLQNRRLMRSMSHVIYVTEHFLQRRYPTPGKWIACSNVVVDAGDQRVLERRIARIKSMTTGQLLTLTTVAAVDVRYKDQETVFRALSKMGAEAAFFRYRVIGQGNPQRLLGLAQQYGVANLVEFVGAVRHAEIPGLLDETDIYIQPSRMEGLPRALIEAMSRGCPSLGSTAGGIPELLPPRRVFEKGDYQALSRMLTQFSPAEMLKDAGENFERAKDFDTGVLQARRERFFAEFLSDSPLPYVHSVTVPVRRFR